MLPAMISAVIDNEKSEVSIQGELRLLDKARYELNVLQTELKSRGIYVTRMDKRTLKKDINAVLRQDGFGRLPEGDKQKLISFFALGRAAYQGMAIVAGHEMAMKGASYVDPRLGPFARTEDGGHLATSCPTLGDFPVFHDIGQVPGGPPPPYETLHTEMGEDGVWTNHVACLIEGKATWYFKDGPETTKVVHLSKGYINEAQDNMWADRPCKDPNGRPLTKVTLTTDHETAWRILWRGDLPSAHHFYENTRCVEQAAGPKQWTAATVEGYEGKTFPW